MSGPTSTSTTDSSSSFRTNRVVCRSFGIDPGSRFTGWGVVEISGSDTRFVDAGVIKLNAKAPLYTRLLEVHAGLSEQLIRFKPELICLESVFHHKSAQSALVLGQARGVALFTAAEIGVPIVEVTPAQVKQMVTGNGRADKTQVGEMVRLMLGIQLKLQTDAADAVAVAIAGASLQRFQTIEALAKQTRSTP